MLRFQDADENKALWSVIKVQLLDLEVTLLP